VSKENTNERKILDSEKKENRSEIRKGECSEDGR
jgi:hypothetical protein